MFFRILRNDLSHRRVTNTILLLFIALAAMFVSSSVSNIWTVSTAQTDYFDRAGMSDYFVLMRSSPENEGFEEKVKGFEHVDSYTRDELLFVSGDQVEHTEKNDAQQNGVIMLTTLNNSSLTYFDKDNHPLEKIAQGDMYLPQKVLDSGAFREGERLKITVGERSVSVTVRGIIKDALFGSSFVGANRFIISQSDFDRLNGSDIAPEYRGCVYGFMSDDTDALLSELVDSDVNMLTKGSRSLIAMANIFDIIIAAMFFLVSVCLIIISFVVLSFTIRFTVTQEFREIGVMKAIGIPDSKTQSLYLVKYFFLAVIGGALGFVGGIPFGSFLMQNAAGSMVIENKNPFGINLICSLLVVLIVMLFCRKCTRDTEKYTPVDAVRSGNTGETYSKKSLLSLSKGRLRPAWFLAINDLLTGARSFFVMALTFALSLILIIVVADTVTTLKGDGIVELMSLARSDVYLSDSSESMDFINSDGHELIKQLLSETEKTLEENNISGSASMDAGLYIKLKNGDKKYTSYAYQGVGTTADMYTYMEGLPPKRAGEIAITPQVAKALNLSMGDTVTMMDMDGEREMLVTAIFQTMMDMGDGVRFHEDEKIDYSQISGCLALQIRFDDQCDGKELERRYMLLEELFPEYEVLSGGEYMDKLIGVADTVDKVRMALLPVLLMVCMLVTVLLERSFIAKEKSETALLKATGFNDWFVIKRDMLRVLAVALISTAVAIPLSTPVAQITSGIVFRIMGAQSVVFEINPLEVYLIYPLLLLALTLTAVFLTALSTRKITASQTAGIE